MDTSIFKVSTIFLITVMCFCGVLEVNANQKKDDIIIVMEGKLSRKGLRSSEEPVAQVQNFNNEVAITFYSDQGDVIINVMDENFGVVYFDYVKSPKTESISLEGCNSGFYYIQIVTPKDTYYATIYKD